MKDTLLEIVSLLSIILGLTIGFFFIFDYTPVDSFFLEKDDDNAFIQGQILEKQVKSNLTILKIYGCNVFNAYSDTPIDKKVNESIFVQGSFIDGNFFIEAYT